MGWELHEGRWGGLKGPDPHDGRDFRVALNARRLGISAARPESASLLGLFPPVYDQGPLGSCVSWTYRACREYLTRKIGHGLQPLSPLWFYYNARARFWPDQVAEDTGLYLRDGMRTLAGRGFAREEDWPYDPGKFAAAPPAASYAPALWYRNIVGYRVESLGEMLDVVAAGWPVAIGFTVRTNFWQAAGHGDVPMPQGFAEGGHALCAAGYRFDPAWEGGGYVEARNSWGSGPAGFTLDGNLRFPFAFLEASDVFPDAWAVALKEEAAQPPDG